MTTNNKQEGEFRQEFNEFYRLDSDGGRLASPLKITSWWWNQICVRDIQIKKAIIDKIIELLPITPVNSDKKVYKAGFYQGQKFVNTELRWRLEELKKQIII